MAQYTYAPLPARTIRVLHLHPGPPAAPLQATLEDLPLPPATTTRHAETPPSNYECVSYVWGSGAKPFAIHLTPTTDDTSPLPLRALPITASLDSLLRRLRKPPLPHGQRKRGLPNPQIRTLWADAVCINQADPVEKGAQVALMPAIYGAARRVVVDLGEETPGLADALALMGAWWRKYVWSGFVIGKNVLTPEEMGVFHGFELPDRRERRRLEGAVMPGAEDPRWDAVAAFYCRPWFTRLWVVQEFVLAREVQAVCGRRMVPWRDVIAPTLYTRGGGHMPSWARVCQTMSAQHAVKLMTHQRQVFFMMRSPEHPAFRPDGQHGYDFLTLLENFQVSNVTRRRDKYFALMGLAENVSGDEPELQPDYISPIETVITRVGGFLWREGNGSHVLLTRGLWQQQEPGVKIPSWIPDFTGNGDYAKVLNRSAVVARHYSAAGNTGFHMTMTPGIPHLVTVSGVFVDTVDQDPFLQMPVTDLVEQRWDNTIGSGDDMTWWTWRQAAFNLRAVFGDIALTSPLPTSLSDQAVLSAFMFGSEGNTEAMTDRQRAIGLRLMSWFAVYRDLPDGEKMPLGRIYRALEQEFAAPRPIVKACGDAFRRRIVDVTCQGRQLARTRRGRPASLPSCFRRGDEIWVVRGVSLPLLLRKSKEYLGCYQLVGSCYVHGMMNGEALQQGRTFEQVTLC